MEVAFNTSLKLYHKIYVKSHQDIRRRNIETSLITILYGLLIFSNMLMYCTNKISKLRLMILFFSNNLGN